MMDDLPLSPHPTRTNIVKAAAYGFEDFVPAGSSKRIVVATTRDALFLPKRIVIPHYLCTNIVLKDVCWNGKTLFEEGVPAELFSENENFFLPFRGSDCRRFEFTVMNYAATHSNFRGGLIGEGHS